MANWQGGSFDKRKFGKAERVKVILQMKAKGRAIRRVYFLQRIVRGVETKKPNQKTDSVLRCVRDSNPWPHAWQACILTNWTNAPFDFFLFFSCYLSRLRCKGTTIFWICNSWSNFFFKKDEKSFINRQRSTGIYLFSLEESLGRGMFYLFPDRPISEWTSKRGRHRMKKGIWKTDCLSKSLFLFLMTSMCLGFTGFQRRSRCGFPLDCLCTYPP